ncbi:hypothetical protein [Flavobacterium sp.]|uniref:hypothetical protein n=1 Tax=Flavobacterium sp. TaxID=239 RepID=UPI00286E0D45|nr:hypothetical protein [Flavobacterium sp.]
MKTNHIKYYSLLFLVFFTFSNFCKIKDKEAKEIDCVMLLVNAKTKKSIKICDKIIADRVEFYLGVAKSIDRENQERGEQPWVVITYDGLVIEMQDDFIKSITITNKKWKLNAFTIGSTLEQIAAKHERIESKYKNDLHYKIKDSKGILFAEVDPDKKVNKIGVVFH